MSFEGARLVDALGDLGHAPHLARVADGGQRVDLALEEHLDAHGHVVHEAARPGDLVQGEQLDLVEAAPALHAVQVELEDVLERGVGVHQAPFPRHLAQLVHDGGDVDALRAAGGAGLAAGAEPDEAALGRRAPRRRAARRA